MGVTQSMSQSMNYSFSHFVLVSLKREREVAAWFRRWSSDVECSPLFSRCEQKRICQFRPVASLFNHRAASVYVVRPEEGCERECISRVSRLICWKHPWFARTGMKFFRVVSPVMLCQDCAVRRQQHENIHIIWPPVLHPKCKMWLWSTKPV